MRSLNPKDPFHMGFYKLVGHDPVPVADTIEWAEYMETTERRGERRVGLDTIGTTRVSTVFLGLDHNHAFDGSPPLLFETMVFGGPKKPSPLGGDREYQEEQYQARYSTWESALAGHRKVVAEIRKADQFIGQLTNEDKQHGCQD